MYRIECSPSIRAISTTLMNTFCVLVWFSETYRRGKTPASKFQLSMASAKFKTALLKWHWASSRMFVSDKSLCHDDHLDLFFQPPTIHDAVTAQTSIQMHRRTDGRTNKYNIICPHAILCGGDIKRAGHVFKLSNLSKSIKVVSCKKLTKSRHLHVQIFSTF